MTVKTPRVANKIKIRVTVVAPYADWDIIIIILKIICTLHTLLINGRIKWKNGGRKKGKLNHSCLSTKCI